MRLKKSQILTIVFLVLFLLSFSQYFIQEVSSVDWDSRERTNKCYRANGSLAPPGAKACGSDLPSSYESTSIYECVEGTEQSIILVYTWKRDKRCGSAGCTATRREVGCNCSAVGSNVPALNHGETTCGLVITSQPYRCFDGSTSLYGSPCQDPLVCRGGLCVNPDVTTPTAPGGDTTSGDDSTSPGTGPTSSGTSSGASGGVGSLSEISTPMQWTIGTDPVNYIVVVLKTIIGLAGLVAAALIVFGAYTLITSSGEPENIAKGQKMITNAIIGLVIAAIAFLIVNFAIEIAKGAF